MPPKPHVPPDQNTLDRIARDRLKAWMLAQSMTQQTLADAIGRKSAWMSRYLSAEFNADLETLRAMAGAFGRTVNALFFDDPDDPDVAAVVAMYTALKPSARATVRELLWLLSRRETLEKALKSPAGPKR